MQGLIIQEKHLRERTHIQDLIVIEKLQSIAAKDKVLIIQQQKAINKYKNMTNDQLTTALDSLYQLENQ
jgi:hypothetical protein